MTPTALAGGFFGKLPSRGDFVRSGLPAETLDTLDRWTAGGLHAAEAELGDRFDAVWERAPHWFFALPAGVLHRQAAAGGVWVPSVDRAGRCFPLLLLLLHAPGASIRPLFPPLEALARDAVFRDTEPDALERRMAPLLRASLEGNTLVPYGWWREGAHMAARLPEGAEFIGMLQPRLEGRTPS